MVILYRSVSSFSPTLIFLPLLHVRSVLAIGLCGALLHLTLPSAFATGDLPVINVSGPHGDNGRDGHSYHSRAGTAQHGRNGGHAGPAQPGFDAGKIHVTLSSENPTSDLPQTGFFTLRGNLVAPNHSTSEIDLQLPLHSRGMVELLAHGGNGGKGGDGGQGEDGGRGHNGQDATQFSYGTNGGRGGGGGNGGNATSGGDGGRGGKIQVNAGVKNMHLFMLMEVPQVVGGRGGAPGVNGRSGNGGAGGSGGSSYSWTTHRTEHHQEWCDEGEGRGHYKTHSIQVPEYHTNPGGSQGPSGPDGRSGCAQVFRGRDGDHGDYAFVVTGDGTYAGRYAQKYDLRLVDFKLDSENGDGINEPDEKMILSHIKILNSGGMPTPPYQKVKLFLKSENWVISSHKAIKVPRSLRPQEVIELTDTLTFTIKSHQVRDDDVGDAFVASDSISPVAQMPIVDRVFQGFRKPKTFEIKYPIKITPIAGVESLSPGSRTQVTFEVENISDRDFGGNSELRRQIELQLGYKSGDLNPNTIVFTSPDGHPINIESGFVQQILNLDAHQKIEIKGTLELTDNAELYTSANLGMTLLLGKIYDPDQNQPIQFREFPVSVAQVYHKTPGSRILLLTNKKTTREEFLAWSQIAQQLRTPIDVWHLSLNGRLDFEEILHDSGSSLFNDFRGQTIVLLDNPFDLDQSTYRQKTQTRGLDFLAKEQFLKGVQEHDIHLYAVGSDPESLGEYLIPIDRLPEMSEGILETKNYENWHQLVQAPSQINYQVKVAPVKSRKMAIFYRSHTEYMQYKAEKIQKYLDRKDPDQRFIVNYEVAPSHYQEDDGMIRIRRTLDLNKTGMVLISPEEENVNLHSPEFILSQNNMRGLISSFSFHEKLELLKRYLLELESPVIRREVVLDIQTWNSLSEAILNDLAFEQGILTGKMRNYGLTDEEILGKLPYLEKFSKFFGEMKFSAREENHAPAVRLLDYNNPSAEVIYDILGKMKILTNTSSNLIKGLFGLRGAHVDRVTNRLLKDSFNQFFGNSSGGRVKGFFTRLMPQEALIQENRNQAKAALARFMDNIETGWKLDHKKYNQSKTSGSDRLGFRDYILQIALSSDHKISGLRPGSSFWNKPIDRIFDESSTQRFFNHDQERARKRQSVIDEMRTSQEKNLLPPAYSQ